VLGIADMKTFQQFMEGQVGIDRVMGARIRRADKKINQQYKDITSPKDPNTLETLLKRV